jgi:hypothetical protein
MLSGLDPITCTACKAVAISQSDKRPKMLLYI